MKLSEAYAQYKIMPILQLHQKRVAAVGKLIGKNLSTTMENTPVILACLLHDMGNIIKFNLSALPQLCQPEGVEYWQGVKEKMMQRYGNDEHIATVAIAEELGASDRVQNLISCVGFTQVYKNLASDHLEDKIVCYADQRVGPYGVLDLSDRFRESRARRIKQGLPIDPHAEDLYAAHHQLEKQIFASCKLQPHDINDEAVSSIIPQFDDFEL